MDSQNNSNNPNSPTPDPLTPPQNSVPPTPPQSPPDPLSSAFPQPTLVLPTQTANAPTPLSSLSAPTPPSAFTPPTSQQPSDVPATWPPAQPFSPKTTAEPLSTWPLTSPLETPATPNSLPTQGETNQPLSTWNPQPLGAQQTPDIASGTNITPAQQWPQPPTPQINPPSLPTDPSQLFSTSPAQNAPSTTLPPTPPTSESQNIDNIPSPTTSFDSAPTDLSHLITDNPPIPPQIDNGYPQTAQTNQPSLSIPDNIVSQPYNANPDVPNIPSSEKHKGIPKWLIGIGVGLLLIVIGASAYFILGIGQPSSKPTTSLPATQAPPKKPTVPQPPNTQTPSGGFGQFEGTPSASPISTPKPATSAAELLRQRNQ